jgi:VWFA-related protein
MADFAYGTGGTFFHNNNDLEIGLRRTADPPEFVYVLGFSPQRLDGKFHKLKVKVNQSEKLTVQARQGYYALRAPSVQ